MGSTGIHIQGGTVNKKSAELVTDSIVRIFKSGAKSNMDQDTIKLALQQLGNLGTVNHTSVSGSSVSMK